MKQGIHLHFCVAKLRKTHKTDNILLRYFHEKRTNNHLQVNPSLQKDRTNRHMQSMSLCHIDNVTESLDANRIEKDIWLKRDTKPWNVEYIFGLKKDELSSYIGRESELIGKTGKEQAFLSCGSCGETKFGIGNVEYKILLLSAKSQNNVKNRPQDQ